MRRYYSAIVCLGIGMALGSWLSSTRLDGQNANAAAATPAAVVWQYKTLQVDATSLQSKLSALGLDGWEVFSVSALSATSPYDQLFQVVAKRSH